MNSTERRFILKALHESGDQLLSEFYGLSDEELRWRPAPEELSLKETVAHLRDAQELALAQLRAIMEESRRPLPCWDIDLLPRERDYQGQDVYDLLRQCEKVRRELTYFFWGLEPEDWDRAGRHPYRGTVSLGQLVKELSEHDLAHLWEVRKLKVRLTRDKAGV
ncbi:MAG TPA: DinB family protein [Dehalococcoidia bacterium]|nr:DinB family protein [Dehalococcoidia bacterium]